MPIWPTFKTGLFYLLLLIVNQTAFAQLANLQFKHLTPNDGLTQSVIQNIYTDSYGFVWMTGLDGINRFDGSRCLANKEIAPGLAGVAGTWGIVEDKLGNIWFGYNDGLIKFSYSQQAFSIMPLNQLLSNKVDNNSRVYSPALVDAENNLVVGLNDNEAFIYHPSTSSITKLTPPNFLKGGFGNMFLKTKNKAFTNNLYMAMQADTTIFIYRYSGIKNSQSDWQLVTSSHWSIISSNPSIAMQDDNTLVLIDKNQIASYQFNTNQFKIKKCSVGSSPGLVIDLNKNIWVGSDDDGLYAFDGKTLEVKAHYQNEPNNAGSIMGNTVGPYADKLGNLWVATKFNGVDYCNLADTKFTTYFTQKQSLAAASCSFIRDIVQDGQGYFYAATLDKGIVVLDSNLQFVKNLPGIPSQLACPDMLLQGQWLYIGSDLSSTHTLYKYHLANHSVKKIANKYCSKWDCNSVYQLSAMQDGNLLAGTYGGLWKIKTNTNTFEPIPGITEEYGCVVFTHQDRYGKIYKGVINGGFSVYQSRLGGYKNVFEFEKKLTVKHCAEINDSLMWLATNDGLYLFNTVSLSKKKHYTTADGLSNNVVYAVLPDAAGNLWLSTNRGLSYFYVASEIFKNFTVDDGLQANEFNTHAVVRAKDGRIIFSGVNGLSKVEPAMLYKKTKMPTLQLTSIRADSSINPFLFDEKNTLQLPAGSNAIEFEITALCYINAATCKIMYRLAGYDTTWRKAANPGIARFINLPFGKYQLQYRTTNADGEQTMEYKTFAFEIAAHWWQKVWFKIGCILMGVLLTIFLINLYIKNKLQTQTQILAKQLAVAQERERIIADLHDDVGATLSSMNIYGGLAENVWDTQPAESRKMIEKIALTSKDLMNQMGDIIWSMKPNHEEPAAFSNRIKNYAVELLSPMGIAFLVNINDELAQTITQPDKRKILLLITKEALNNVAKYSGATHCHVAFLKVENTIQLSIKDNGVGFDTATTNPQLKSGGQGNGLKNMQQRCQKLNGRFEIITAPSKGVSITCTWPMAIISY